MDIHYYYGSNNYVSRKLQVCDVSQDLVCVVQCPQRACAASNKASYQSNDRRRMRRVIHQSPELDTI